MANYIAVVHKDPKSEFGISFPDFPGCITAGKNIDDECTRYRTLSRATMTTAPSPRIAVADVDRLHDVRHVGVLRDANFADASARQDVRPRRRGDWAGDHLRSGRRRAGGAKRRQDRRRRHAERRLRGAPDLTDGSLDLSFGFKGSRRIDLGSEETDYESAVAIDADGNILLPA